MAGGAYEVRARPQVSALAAMAWRARSCLSCAGRFLGPRRSSIDDDCGSRGVVLVTWCECDICRPCDMCWWKMRSLARSGALRPENDRRSCILRTSTESSERPIMAITQISRARVATCGCPCSVCCVAKGCLRDTIAKGQQDSSIC